ncbi:nucleoside deaminase [Blattabacterium cuenoti]|uniref:nucleoside deaminase n=1 Tax=Blattabacterium cuenoti TaxID=1653831 RepID=UPI001EE9C341|nr:nucleoside deaminase [Blattabacterium cuenoti]
MSFKDIHFMKIAIKEAIIALKNNEIPIGAVITYNNFVIAKTHNLTESLNNSTAHAEILAINIASNFLGKKIRKCVMYITLEPCLMCIGAILCSRIEKIVFGASNTKGFLLNKIKLHTKIIFVSGIMKNKCESLIQDFFLSKRIKYKKNI